MASTRSTSFERSLDQFRRELSDDQKKEFSGANQKYINSMLQDMQAKLGREKGLCKLTRIEKFLSAMKHIEALVAVFLNVHEVVAIVWGPIKLALMAATTWKDSVRQLLDAYQDIGEVLGNLAFFHELIRSSEYHREIVEHYFSDILRFHRCVLDVFSRPDWKTFFKWAWGSFRRQIEPIIESLKGRRDILSDDKLQSHAIFKEVQDSSAYAKDQFRDLSAKLEGTRAAFHSEQSRSNAVQDREMKASLLSKLGVSGLRTDSQLLEPPEQSVGSSGSWVFSHPTFCTWETGESPQESILFLNGSPGTGKSTLARTVIRRLKDKQAREAQSHSCLAYFFFKHDDADLRSTSSMLSHIIAQLINADGTIMRLADEKCSSVDQIEPFTLRALAKDCLTAHRNACLILDGLDEATDKEPEGPLKWCLDQLLPAASSRGCRLKLLFCGQRDGQIDSILSSQPQIRLDKVEYHQRDIEEYSKSRAAEISAQFSLTQQQEEDMITKIAGASRGMFLYAKVVLVNLVSMDSKEDFWDEMLSDKFPDNLEQAYDRVIKRVLTEARTKRQKNVRKILGWVLCSKRPLRWREIQSRFCIDPDKGTFNRDRSLMKGCKKICGSLVDTTACDLFGDVEPEQIINIVHETASKYLVQNGIINLLHEHADMALFCCRYLSSRPVLQASESDSFHDVIQPAYFGFLDYAAAHYFSHIQECKSLEEEFNPPYESVVAVKKAMAKLLNSHGVETPDPSNFSVYSGMLCKDNQDQLSLAIQSCVTTLRKAMEARQEDFSAEFLRFSGRMRFKCPKLHCTMFTTGFLKQNDRDRHLNNHERPFKCTYTDCFAHTIGYASQERLQAHSRSLHPDDSDLEVTFPTSTSNKKWDIFEACKTGNLAEVKRFHDSGIEIKKSRQHGFITPLIVAVRAGHGHVCKFLMDQGVSPYKSEKYQELDRSPMTESIRHQNAQIVELLLHSGFDLEGEGGQSQFALYIALAILHDSKDGLEHLLEARTALEHAAMIGDVAKALFGLSNLPSIITGIYTAHTIDATLVKIWFRRVFAHLTHKKGIESSPGFFIEQPDSPEHRGYKSLLLGHAGLLSQAFGSGCYPFLAFLMDLVNKDDLQVTDDEGLTPLHHFAANYCVTPECESCYVMTKRIIEIDGGVSTNTADNSGKLPANHAMERSPMGWLKVQVLLSHTRNLNHKDNNGKSLLHYATSSDSHLRTFLENDDIDLFIRNSAGQSAFSASLLNRRGIKKGVLEVLIEADRTLAWAADDTERRLTPLHYMLKHKGKAKLYADEISHDEGAIVLLSLPEVENVLRAYLASSGDNDPEVVREFARQKNLNHALEVMDRIGF